MTPGDGDRAAVAPAVAPADARDAVPRPACTVLALGAWLKHTAALLVRDADGRVTLHRSALHGDLGTPGACTAMAASVEALRARCGDRIDAVAHDLHPDFPSTRLALAVAAELGVPALAVQHHHAHAAVPAALAAAAPGTAGRTADRLVAITLDGVGLGTDGTAWGGEVLVVDGPTARRAAHLAPLALPGGDRAALEPWRMASAALHATGRADAIATAFAGLVEAPLLAGLRPLLDRGTRCPATTGAGRWFDAAAGLLGLHARRQREAEAAIALERLAIAAGELDAALSGEPVHARVVAGVGGPAVVDLRPTLARIADLAGTTAGRRAGDVDAAVARRCAALFHRDLADALVQAAVAAARTASVADAVLSGGCCLNRVLADRLEAGLAAAGLRVHRPPPADCGDAGLAPGQAWVALARLDAGAAGDTVADAAPSPGRARARPAAPAVAPTPVELTPCA